MCTFQSLTRMTISKLMKPTDETMTTYRYLLLWIVRLIHADPNLMLHVSFLTLFLPVTTFVDCSFVILYSQVAYIVKNMDLD